MPPARAGRAATPPGGSCATASSPRGESASASSSSSRGSTVRVGQGRLPARALPAGEARNSGVASTVSISRPAACAAATRWGPSSSARAPLLRLRRRISLSVLFWRLPIIMIGDLKNFWQRLQTGVEVAVAAGALPDKLLGVRDGFLRYFHDGLDRSVSVAVVPQSIEEPPLGLLISDEEVIRLTRKRALDLEQALADTYHFYVASEAGLHSIEVEGKLRYFVRYWTVVRTLIGESWGSSGSIQLPQ